MNNKQKFILLRIVTAAAAFAALMVLAAGGEVNLLLFLIPYLVIGYDVLWSGAKDLIRGRVFGESLLMSIASLGIIILGEYPVAPAVMLLYRTGKLFFDVSADRVGRYVASLTDIEPEYAVVLRGAKELRCEPKEVNAGELIIVRPGERVPLDGRVTEGSASLDTGAVTGESAPRDIAPGDRVLSGSVVLSGTVKVEVISGYKDSTVSKIVGFASDFSEKKARTENFIKRFAKVYTPVVVIGALILAVVAPLVTGTRTPWISAGLVLLSVSCTGGVVVSVSLSFFGGVAGALRRGILIKSAASAEQLARTDVVVLDKTGTLTFGSFDVIEICSDIDKDELVRLAATAEQGSDHPVARSVRGIYKGELIPPKRVEEIPGKGVISDGVACGNYALMEHLGIGCDEAVAAGSVVYVARDNKYIGHIVTADRIKENSQAAVEDLHSLGIFTVMMTGDNMAAARTVADVLGIDEVHSDLLPDTKVSKLEEIEAEVGLDSAVCYVGNGINDASVLASAEVGIAMGGMNSDAAMDTADIVIMDDDPAKVAEAVYLARRAVRTARQNIILCLGVKGIVLVLGALGIAGMWAAVLADVAAGAVAVLNAMRCLKNER